MNSKKVRDLTLTAPLSSPDSSKHLSRLRTDSMGMRFVWGVIVYLGLLQTSPFSLIASTVEVQQPGSVSSQLPGSTSLDTDGGLDLSVLDLPAFEIELQKPSSQTNSKEKTSEQKYHVGDLFRFEVRAPTEKIEKHSLLEPLRVELPPGGTSLASQGWMIHDSRLRVNGSKEGLSPQESQKEQAPESRGESIFEISAVALKSGKLSFPSVVIKNAEGKAIGRTIPLVVTIESAIQEKDPKPTEPEAVIPPLALPFPLILVLGFALVVLLALAGGAYALYRVWKKRKKSPLAQLAPVWIPEEDLALRHLHQLERSHFIEQGKFKEYYFRLSDIVKEYLGKRYHFDAPECTTREMLIALRERLFEEDLRESVEELFAQLDLVKFTDHLPVASEPAALLEAARKFIQRTKKVRNSVLTDPSTESSGQASDRPSGSDPSAPAGPIKGSSYANQ